MKSSLLKNKPVEITYGEVDKIMKSLGFQSRIELSKDEVKERLLGMPRYFIVYFNREYDPFYSLFLQPEDTLVRPRALFFLILELADFGYIEEQTDFIEMIEKNRLAEKQAA